MDSNVIEKIKNLKEEDLAYYQKLISFFDLIGLTTTDLENLVTFVKSFPQMIETINAIVRDQNLINKKLDSKNSDLESNKSNPLDEFNKERKTLNIYGRQ